MKKKILCIGPISGGGVSTINNEVIKIIKEIDIIAEIILDTSKLLENNNKIFGYIVLYFSTIAKVILKNPDIVYLQIAQTGYFHQSIFLLISKLFNKETIAHFHAKPDLKSTTSKYQLKAIINSQKYIDKMIVLTDTSKKNLHKYGYLKSIFVIPNFVDKKNLPVTVKTIKEKKYFLYIGRMHKQKGIFEILEIADNFKKEEFIFIGDFSDKETEQSFEYRIKRSNNCKWLGAVYNDEKYKYINNSKFFIFPTLWKGEVFPLTLVETALLGCIPIVNPIGSINDIIKDEYNGFIIEGNDTLNTIQKISSILNKGDEYIQTISNNAVTFANKYFTSEKVKKILLRVILEK